MRKRIAFGMVAAIAIVMAGIVSAYAKPPKEKFSAPFSFTQTYHTVDFYNGPAIYYGRTVTIVYTATNEWTWKVKGEDVKEKLTQKGTAQIYEGETTTTLIEERKFSAREDFDDKGGDACTKIGDWYQPHWWSPLMERYKYDWHVHKVYRFTIKCKDGVWHYKSVAKTHPPTVTREGTVGG